MFDVIFADPVSAKHVADRLRRTETWLVLLRREQPGDEHAIERVHVAAFMRADDPTATPPEATLVDDLRAAHDWIAQLSIVAVRDSGVVGHVLCTRARLERGQPVLALAPIGVLPEHQGVGVGHALMHAVLGAADAMGESLVGLVGDRGYYARFGFQMATEVGIEPADPSWSEHFQVRPLTAYTPTLTGRFQYAAPFSAL
jgi:putative acetyltransferase